jgi:hypothetical protein
MCSSKGSITSPFPSTPSTTNNLHTAVLAETFFPLHWQYLGRRGGYIRAMEKYKVQLLVPLAFIQATKPPKPLVVLITCKENHSTVPLIVTFSYILHDRNLIWIFQCLFQDAFVTCELWTCKECGRKLWWVMLSYYTQQLFGGGGGKGGLKAKIQTRDLLNRKEC